MAVRVLQNSFLSGEISHSMFGRVDSPVYAQAAARVENFIVQAQGSLVTRPGFQFVSQAKNSALPVRLIPFRFASDQTLVLVFGDRTLRFVTQGKQLLTSSNQIYEISTQYSANDLFELDFTQNADILTITSSKYPPTELRRYGATDWRFQAVTTAPTIQPPSSISLSAYYPNGTKDEDKNKITATYVVTAVDSEDRESVASAEKSGTCNYYATGGYMNVSWSAVGGAVRYRVYRSVSGVFGFLGQTEGTSIRDEGAEPDTTTTPPRYAQPFSGGTGTITSVKVIDGGSGYYASNNTVKMPSTLSIPCVYVCGYSEGALDGSADDTLNGKLILHIYNNGQEVFTYDLPQTKPTRYQGPDKMQWLVAFCCNPKDNNGNYPPIIVDLGNIAGQTLTNPTIRISFDGLGGDSGWGTPPLPSDTNNQYYDELQYVKSFSSNSTFVSMHADSGNGISFVSFLQSFPQNVHYEFPVTITDTKGSGANCTALSINGVIDSVRVNAGGSGYVAPSLSVQSSGSGAILQAELSTQDTWEYPSAVTQFDQRRIFAGSNASPLKVWMTNAGQQSLMMYHLPVLSDDRIELTAVASDADKIKHAVALDSLILFTGSSELRVYTQNSDALAPDSVAVRAQSYEGANNCQPVIANSSVIYAASRGGHIRALQYTYQSSGYDSNDMSLLAAHLFNGYEIKDLTLAKAPERIIWCVSSSGKLLGFTFYPDQNIAAWHQHTTDGVFESCCAVSEGNEDHLYVVVRRQINGQWLRYIERLSNITYSNDTASRQLDSYIDTEVNNNTRALTLSDSGMVLTGLNHLEGKTVVAVVDGIPQPETTVTNGQITIDVTGNVIAVGIPYKSILHTVPLTASAQGRLQGSVKNISEIFLRIGHNGDIFAGRYPDGELFPCKTKELEFKRQASESKIVRLSIDGNWDYQGQYAIEHRNALPLEIQAITGNVNIEGVRG